MAPKLRPRMAPWPLSSATGLAHRLIGNFGFSDVGRSFDGVQYNLNRSKLNLTLFGGRPTRGVFQVDGWGELNINVFYGALTGQVGGVRRAPASGVSSVWGIRTCATEC